MASFSCMIVFATGGSGGLGKSTGARWTAQFLAATLRKHVVLVDGNPGQQSQRVALHVPESYSLEDARLNGLKRALVPPKRLRTAYAILAGPLQPNGPGVIDDYYDAIMGCARLAQIIVVDADRTDERLWNDEHSFSGGVMRPMVEEHGARILFRIGQSGSQLDDGLGALDAIGRPDRTMAIGVAPPDVRPWSKNRWTETLQGLARFGGVDRWDAVSRKMIDGDAPGYRPGSEPAWLLSSAMWAGVDKETIKRLRRGGGWASRRR